MENFHCSIYTTYEYFCEYRANKKIYVTLDKTVFFEIDEIFPSKPLLFLLKKIKLKPAAKRTAHAVVTATVHRLQFHLLGGNSFEHLVFAFLQQTGDWKSIEWLGESGQDNGKDIWAEKDNATHCFQCANYQQLTFAKIVTDMDKLAQHETVPDHLTIVCGGNVTDGLRQKTRSYGLSKRFGTVTIWSGPELEEKIRKQSPEILLRFFEGHPFPETRN